MEKTEPNPSSKVIVLSKLVNDFWQSEQGAKANTKKIKKTKKKSLTECQDQNKDITPAIGSNTENSIKK